MKAEQANTIAHQALEDLNAALKAGKSDQFIAYLAMLARFHTYSYGNVLLILTQRPDATQVAGFHRWKQMGRSVKKGEKAITIIAPMQFRSSDDDDDRKPQLRFRGACVFDAKQTEGEPLPEPATVQGDPSDRLHRLHTLISDHDILIDHDDLPFGADGVSRGGRISLRAGLDTAQQFSVLVHEFAHELLHRSKDRRATKVIRETEAEAVAFVVCQAIGLDPGTASSDYILSYNGTCKTLATSLHRIQSTASKIICGLME